MGKSNAAAMLRRLGTPVFDADAEVHKMMQSGGEAVTAVGVAFPGVVKNGAVDRAALGQRVFDDTPTLRRLEAIIHPRVRRAEQRFLVRAASRRVGLVVLDIPLLFEGSSARRCDATLVVTAPAAVQQARVLSRPGMTRERFLAIRARQMPEVEKCRRADFVVPTGVNKRCTLRRLTKIVTLLRDGRRRQALTSLRRRRHARNRSRH
jgi:dephospho-CoA kinase